MLSCHFYETRLFINNWLIILLVSCEIADYCLVQLLTSDCQDLSLENGTNFSQACESNCLLLNGTTVHSIV